MIFWNLNNLSILIFIILLLLWLFFSLLLFKREKLKVLFIFFSYLFLIINIFEFKWWYNTQIYNIEWWKVVFVLDVSKSMNVLDIDYNNVDKSRIATSKYLIEEYITNSNNQYWLMVFAWSALEMLPFTSDLWIFKTVLSWLSNNNINKYWTNLNSVIELLHYYFINDLDGWLAVIFTDWWDDTINISKDLLNSLTEKNVKILIVWIWSLEWWYIPEWVDFFWKQLYKTYKNKIITSKLNNIELENISSEHDFDYLKISNKSDFNKIDEIINKNINKVNIEKNIDYRIDYTRFLVFISFIFFIIYLISINIPWRKK